MTKRKAVDDSVDFFTNTTLPDVIEFEPCADCLKIVSFNASSLKAALSKGLPRYLQAEQPDLLLLQETKGTDDEKLTSEYPELTQMFEHRVHATGTKKGYSGVAIWSKIKPVSVMLDSLMIAT